MIQKFQNLSLVLERMLVLYERALPLMDREKSDLIQLDFEKLFGVMREKDEILSALRALDKDRLRIQDQCSLVMELESEEITLKNIAEKLIQEGGSSSEMGRRLKNLRERLWAAMSALKDKVDRNRRVTEKSLSTLQSVAAHLSSALGGKKSRTGGGGTYTGRAKFIEKIENTGSIVEKRL